MRADREHAGTRRSRPPDRRDRVVRMGRQIDDRVAGTGERLVELRCRVRAHRIAAGRLDRTCKAVRPDQVLAEDRDATSGHLFDLH
jgi:hypothetical protein